MNEETYESCGATATFKGRIELPLSQLRACYREVVAGKYTRMVERAANDPASGGCYIGFDLYLCDVHASMMLNPMVGCKSLTCPDRHLVHSHS
jgi:hypothetical protein